MCNYLSVRDTTRETREERDFIAVRIFLAIFLPPLLLFFLPYRAHKSRAFQHLYVTVGLIGRPAHECAILSDRYRARARGAIVLVGFSSEREAVLPTTAPGASRR